MTARKTRTLHTTGPASTNFTALSPWTRRLYELLADGQPHHIDDLLADASNHVPPASALRHAQSQCVAKSGHPSAAESYRLVARGQRRKASQALAGIRRAGLITDKGTTVTAVPALVTAWQSRPMPVP